MNAEHRFKVVHYPEYANPDAREYDNTSLPEYLAPGDMETFFRYCNVVPDKHAFKVDVCVPWLTEILA